jgi:hypothetical protein
MSTAITTLLITKLGIPVAKALAGLWIENKVGVAVTGGVIDIVGGQWADRVGRQRLESQFQKIGDDLAKRIAPCLTDMSDGAVEQLAAHLSLLVREQMEDVKTLVHGGVAIDKVAARFAEKDKRWQTLREQGQFDANAQAGYDHALKIIAQALLGYLGKLPDWQPAVELQQLQQLDSILDLLLTERNARQQGLDEYEKCYRDALARSCDETALFGLPPGKFDETVKHMPLTETFVTLSMRDDGTGGGGAAPDMLDMLDRKGPLRVVIAGDAGSGKTTLVRWIAMAAAAGRMSAQDRTVVDIPKGATDALIETTLTPPHIDWGLRIPFLIRLREVKEGHLPPQSEWSALKVGGLPDQPPNWVHSITSTGRALIILDGLDEVDARRRRSILKDVWDSYLKDKLNACIITSRLAALSGLDRELESFRRLHLDPLSPEDRTRLIELWYEASSRRVDPKRLPAPNSRARDLRLEIDRKPVLRQLTTNPLLCAMVCALHHGSGNKLPATAAGLCADMIEMLLHRRDTDQNMKVNPDYDDIDVDIRRALITRVADSMVSNGTSDMEFTQAKDLVASELDLFKLPTHLAGNSERVLIALCERSGVIRRPQVDRVDFTHNKLKEYLAACAAAADQKAIAVAKYLPDSTWDEVAQFMVNLPNQRANADRLIRSIWKRLEKLPPKSVYRLPTMVALSVIDDKRDLRRDLGYLALCCATVATQLDPELRRHANTLRAVLIPPTNQWEAEKLAAMDDLPLDDLHYQVGWPEPVAAATALCLRLTGSDAAMVQLRGFADDERKSVAMEVVQALDPAKCRGFWRWLIKRLPDESKEGLPKAVTSRIKSPTYLIMDICGDSLDLSGLVYLNNLDYLEQLTGVRILRLNNTAVSDLSALKGLQNLQILELRNTAVSDLSALKRLQNLQILALSNTAVSDLSALKGLQNLHTLDLRNTAVSDLSALKGLQNLHTLDLRNTAVSNLSALKGLQNLQIVYLNDTAVRDLSVLSGLQNLQHLDLRNTAPRDISVLKKKKSLLIIGP